VLCCLFLRVGANRCCQQIHDWFKTRRKRSAQVSQPKALLDLSGKAPRKPTPQQFHHAYSLVYYKPPNSPLRDEVEDLWNRRTEQDVVNTLSPFMKSTEGNERLNFHNAVMRWKCSLLTETERKEIQSWIDNDTLDKEEKMTRPWKAGQEDGVDDASAENEYIQRYVYSSSMTMMSQTNICTQFYRCPPRYSRTGSSTD